MSFLGDFPKKIKKMFKENSWKIKENYRRKKQWKAPIKKQQEN
jgi:hypothetical protein